MAKLRNIRYITTFNKNNAANRIKIMGGHDSHAGPLFQVPNPDIYKVEDAPQLKKVQDALAKRGLRDPWLRNEVWRYTTLPGSAKMQCFKALTRGAIVGIPAFLITIAIEQAYGITYKPDHGHDQHGHH